jgi:hypothetical protein
MKNKYKHVSYNQVIHFNGREHDGEREKNVNGFHEFDQCDLVGG